MNRIILSLAILPFFTSCHFVEKVEKRAKTINRYEKVALHLSKENRELRTKINSLKFDIQQYKSKITYLELKVEKKAVRKIASISHRRPPFKQDMVQFSTYKWTPQQLKSVAIESFAKKDFKKSAQYFYSLVKHYPQHKFIKDDVLFKAGLSAYESHQYYDQAVEMLSRIVADYPTSKYYRGAKLWMSLAELKRGNKDLFFKTVEEFRKKYRNTAEWKIISRHYYEIVRKYKKI